MNQPLWFTKLVEQLSPAQVLEWHERKTVLRQEAGYGRLHAEALALILVQLRTPANKCQTQPDWVIELVERLSPDQRDLYEERAAIMEYDGKLSRVTAELYALLDMLRKHPDILR